MKSLHVLFVVLLGVSFVFASTPEEKDTAVKWAKAEQGYKICLTSENDGVKTSAASYIRKYKLAGAVDELKALLSDENSEKVKMSAALALIDVCGDKGRNAVETALQSEENEIVVEFYKSMLNAQITAQN